MMTTGHNIYLIDLPLMVLLISLVYSGTRYDRWPAIFGEAVRWGGRLASFLVGIGIVLFIVTRL